MISTDSLLPFEYNSNNIIDLPYPLPAYDVQDYDLFDPKDKEKFITDLERFIRNSIEYRSMVQFLRDNVNMNQCAFLNNVTNEDSFKIRIELHHSPFTLRDICMTILSKRMRNNECLNIESVAYEVMYIHYCLMVGLIPLSETVHELVHSQYLFIPIDKVYGYYREFIRQYELDIDPDILDKFYQLEQLTLDGNMNNHYKDILEKKYITINVDGLNQIDELHQLQDILKNKIYELKEDNNTISNYKINKHQDNIIEMNAFSLYKK